ncbi:hypothetical protein CCACVL1_02199 [Corchorus capsularis]|uniref:HAT C-terminal dimerisation domain-containing protein n=1 Tax=Corchorus capsularis TaxID=210143 RepID=A0A1R3KAH6_COCAP|nr:hypothetical protein CCACVL1_02199 [Corchorus capsularis]
MECESQSSSPTINSYAKLPVSQLPSPIGDVPTTSTATPTSYMVNQNEEDGTSWLNNVFDENLARKELAHMIMLLDLPLSVVDDMGFRRFTAGLQPFFNIPSQDTIRSDILNIYKEEEFKTRRMIEANESRIAITTNLLTSDHHEKGNMAVTVHFIDSSWTLQKHILRYCHVPPPHTKEVIAEELQKIFSECNLDCKLSTLTLDNCLVSDGVVELLIDNICPDSLMLDGALLNMRCCAHVLNLIVKDGLDVIGDGIDRIRDLVSFWIATAERMERLRDSAQQLGLPNSKELFLDSESEWQSTYLMLETALDYKDVLSHAQQREPLCEIVPTEEDWNISKWVCDSNVTIARMTSRMMEKLEKYWNSVYGIMGVATVLDPRYKKYMLEYCFSKIHGPSCDVEVERIDKICRDLFREYEKKFTDTVVERNNSDIPGVNLDGYDEFIRKEYKKTEVRSEFDYYLEEDVWPRSPDFDILEWWQSYGLEYPMLRRIARDIYAVPVFTKASESTFDSSLCLELTDEE